MSDETQGQDGQKKQVGAALVAGTVAILGHAGATQWLARGLVYNEKFLGKELFFDQKINVKFYAPHKVWVWSQMYWGGRVDELIMQSAGVAGASILLGGFFGLLIAFSKQRDVHRTAHGSARWARESEVRSSDLVFTVEDRLERAKKNGKPRDEACSIVMGKLEDGTLLMNSGPEHVLGNAPTRSGKGIGWVIPTLLMWAGSVVVTDIKGENFQITGWWRSLFSHVIYFNPTDVNSARWNPLLELRLGEESIQDAQNLAEILGSSSGANGNEFWESGAKKFLAAVILYVLYTQENKSLGTCVGLLARFEETFLAFADVSIPESPDAQAFIRSVADAVAGFSESVRGGWAAGAESALALWRDPKVARNTSSSDFKLRDLQYASRPVSLYLVIPPPDLGRLSPLIRLFFEQATDALTSDGVDVQEGRHRLLMLMDEFPQFGTMDKIHRAIAYTAGYGIKWFFIVQGLNQLADRKLYGPENAFLSNCHTRLAYRCNDPDNAKSLCDMIGKTTGLKEQEGESGKKGFTPSLSNKSVSMVEYERDLMTVGELQQMSEHKVLIMNAGENPIKACRVTYYDDPNFIPKYKGKRWGFPTSPLKDFPVQRTSKADEGGSKEASDVGHSEGSDTEWVESSGDSELVSELRSGEAPAPLPDAKIDAQDINAMTDEIPVGMSPREAAIHMTTSAIKASDLEAMIAKALRAGVVSQEHLDMIRGVTPADPEPVATPESEPILPDTPDSGDPVVDEEDDFDPLKDEDQVVSTFDAFGATDSDELMSADANASDVHPEFTSEPLPHDEDVLSMMGLEDEDEDEVEDPGPSLSPAVKDGLKDIFAFTKNDDSSSQTDPEDEPDDVMGTVKIDMDAFQRARQSNATNDAKENQ